MKEQIVRVVVEETDKIINKEIAEKNEQIKQQQILHNQEQAKRLNGRN